MDLFKMDQSSIFSNFESYRSFKGKFFKIPQFFLFIF